MALLTFWQTAMDLDFDPLFQWLDESYYKKQKYVHSWWTKVVTFLYVGI